TGIVVTDPASDPFGPNAIRASTGAIFNVPLVEAEAVAAREFLEKRKIQIIAADSEATTSFLDIDLTKPTAVVLGSEARGLTDTWRNIATAARVPMFGRVDSLNVSVTAAIIFYEALRQRLQLDRNDAAKHK
ncbi:MAG TPA: TrmH family RNA methyltransferase, partial [Phycisphaerae bacterium]|nr:TrmH family RNA methyltransferase [Phycisphaerae bacterium]